MITWSILLIGFLIFLGSLCLHIIIWRINTPKNYFFALLVVFVAIPLAVGVIVINWLKVFYIAPIEWFSILFLYFSFVGAYILSYPAIQASCPSLLMLLIIGGSTSRGITYVELKSGFDSSALVETRLQDLIDSGFAVESNDYYTITKLGKLVLRPFMLLRKLLGLPMGRG